MKEFESERAERRKVRKKTKTTSSAAVPPPLTAVSTVDVEMGDSVGVVPAEPSNASAPRDPAKETVAGGELEDESVYRAREIEALEALIDEDVKKDTGASVSGLYDLVCELFFSILLC